MLLKPSLRLFLEESDISSDILPDLIDLEYNNEGDNASTLRIIVRSSPRLFNADWMPKIFSFIKCELFYEGESFTLNAGTFQITNIKEFVGISYDVIHLDAVSVPIAGRFYEKKNLSFKNVKLETILKEKATNLQLTGNFQVPELFINVEQQEQSDLEFLRMIAGQWGLNVTIDNGQLVVAGDSYFWSIPPILTINRSHYTGDFEHSGYNLYSHCEIKYRIAYNPISGEFSDEKSLRVRDYAVFTDNIVFFRPFRVLHTEAKFPLAIDFQAAYQAMNKIIRENNGAIKGSINLIGRPELVAFNNIRVEGNRFNGNYQILQATHRFNKDTGWQCNCKLRSIPQRAGEVQFTWYDMIAIIQGSLDGFGIDIPGIPGI